MSLVNSDQMNFLLRRQQEPPRPKNMIDANGLQVTVDSIRMAKTKAFANVYAGGKLFTITLTKESAKRLLKA